MSHNTGTKKNTGRFKSSSFIIENNQSTRLFKKIVFVLFFFLFKLCVCAEGGVTKIQTP